MIEPHGKEIYAVSYSPHFPQLEHVLATGGANGITVYERKTEKEGGTPICVYRERSGEVGVYCLTWCVDQYGMVPLLAFGTAQGVIRMIDVQRGKVFRTLIGHGAAVNEMVAHPVNLNLLVSVSSDESARLWNFQSGVCIAVFAGHWGHRDQVLSCV